MPLAGPNRAKHDIRKTARQLFMQTTVMRVQVGEAEVEQLGGCQALEVFLVFIPRIRAANNDLQKEREKNIMCRVY